MSVMSIMRYLHNYLKYHILRCFITMIAVGLSFIDLSKKLSLCNIVSIVSRLCTQSILSITIILFMIVSIDTITSAVISQVLS